LLNSGRREKTDVSALALARSPVAGQRARVAAPPWGCDAHWRAILVEAFRVKGNPREKPRQRVMYLAGIDPQAQELKTNFDEFSACSDAEAVFGGVVRVSVLVAPQGVLLIVHMAHDRPRDRTDGYASDQSTDYQLFHLLSRLP
jgi:hypothetical protein